MILVDSSVFIALADARDQWHDASKNLTRYLDGEEIVISDLIVAEVVTVVGSRAGGKEGMQVFHYFLDNCEIMYGDESLIQHAMKIFLQYDGVLSLSDAFSVLIMNMRGITKIISFDSDFDKVRGILRISE